jgi:predicted ester cyclase
LHLVNDYRKEQDMGEPLNVVSRELAAFNAQDAKTIAASFSPECLKEVPGADLRGGDQVAAWCSALWEAFPDIQVTFAPVAAQGSSVAIEGRCAGTHLGTLRTPGGDIPPTGRHADFKFSEHCKVEGDLIVSVRMYFDRLDLLEQFGIAPAPAAA